MHRRPVLVALRNDHLFRLGADVLDLTTARE